MQYSGTEDEPEAAIVGPREADWLPRVPSRAIFHGASLAKVFAFAATLNEITSGGIARNPVAFASIAFSSVAWVTFQALMQTAAENAVRGVEKETPGRHISHVGLNMFKNLNPVNLG